MTIRVVYGPPGAGKSTYIAEHRKPADLVIDFDTLAVALGSLDSHDHGDHVRSVAGAARHAAIRRTIERGVDAWVIDTMLTTTQLREHAECQYILIDPGQAVTLQRARAAGRPQSSLDSIERWYADPPVPPTAARHIDAHTTNNSDLGAGIGDWW